LKSRHVAGDTVHDIIILADMEEGSTCKPKSKQMLILPLEQFREHCDESALMSCYCGVTFSAIDSREQMFLMRMVVIGSVYNGTRSFIKTAGLSYSLQRSSPSLNHHSLRFILIYSSCRCFRSFCILDFTSLWTEDGIYGED
jgi:hypothetical protein